MATIIPSNITANDRQNFCGNANGGKGGPCPHKGTPSELREMCVRVTCPGWEK